MSDPTRDELASAYLDGEATTDERARVEGDPEVLARVEELRQARELLRDAPVEPPDAARREAAIRGALAATPVVDLRAERARRGLRVVSIAAAVAVVIGALGLLLSTLSSRDDTAKTTSAAAGDAPAAVTTTAAGGERAATAGASTAASVASLGDFPDEQALRDAVRGAVGQKRQATEADDAAPLAAGGASACAPVLPPGASSVFTGTASISGRPVRVDVFVDTGGERQLAVTDAATCMQLFSQPL